MNPDVAPRREITSTIPRKQHNVRFTPESGHWNRPAYYLRRSNSGSLAIFAAIRRASSLLSDLAPPRTCRSLFLLHEAQIADNGEQLLSDVRFTPESGHRNRPAYYLRRSKSGSLAIFAAVRRASSWVSGLAADSAGFVLKYRRLAAFPFAGVQS